MVNQYIEDNRMYFYSTIGHPDTGRGEETQFEVDMSQTPINAKIECIVMSGVHKGETRMFRWLNLNTLWEQQQEESE
tara:strand:- start:62 stop:292 length:231 start_codon:yes stop_codon:yes gene_type:complete